MNSLYVVCLALTLCCCAAQNYRTSMRLDQPTPDLSGYSSSNTFIPKQRQPLQQDMQMQVPSSNYGSGLQQMRPQFEQPKLQQAYGYSQQGKPISNYGMISSIQMDTTPQQSVPMPLSPEDILCQGKQPGTVIPLEDTRIYVTCLDDSKGVSQKCPRHLHYITQVARCERKMSQLLPPCLSNPCQNGGVCSELDIFTYKCDCPSGFEGQQCERDQRACQQNPCGQDGVCKGFRFGSALSYVCICQEGNAYGPSCQQAIPNPCQSTEQYLPLGYSDKGFVMCDGERFFIESCPGTTIWDNSQKTCMSVEMPLAQDQSSYSKGNYQQQPSSYSAYTQPSRSLITGYSGSQQTLPTQQFDPMRVRPQFDVPQQKPIMSQHGYGSIDRTDRIDQQQLDMPKPMMKDQGYGQQMDMTKPIMRDQSMMRDSSMMRDPAMMRDQSMMRDPAMMRDQSMMRDPAMMRDQPMDMTPTSSMFGSKQMQQDGQPWDTSKSHRPQHIGGSFSTSQQLDVSPQKPMISQGYSTGVQQQDMQPQRMVDTSSMLASRPMQQDVQPVSSSYSSVNTPMSDQRRPVVSSSFVQQPQFDVPKQQNYGF
jgi:hypothetical protein